MKQGIAIGVGLMALGVAAAGPAHAQGFYFGPPRHYEAAIVPPGEVLMLVRAAGLRPLTQPARRGNRYLLLASDQMGGQLRVVVDAYDGRIVRVMPAHDPRFAHHPMRPPAMVPSPHYGAPPQHYGAPPPRYSAAPPPEVREPPAVYGSHNPAPRPPATTGSIPDPRQASAPPAADPAPARPARTPVPRPRPAVTAKKSAPAPTETAAAPPPAQPASPPPATAQARPAAPPPTETKLVPVAPLE